MPLGEDQNLLTRNLDSGAVEYNSLFARMAEPVQMGHMLPNSGHKTTVRGSDAALLANPGFSKSVFMAAQENLAMRDNNARPAISHLGAPHSRNSKGKRSISKAEAILYSRAAKVSLSAHLGLYDHLGPRSLSRRHPLAHEVIEGELVKRYIRFERNNPLTTPNPLDPCAGKHGFKRRKCKLFHSKFLTKVEKAEGKAWKFTKKHKGEIALNVGIAVGGLALEAVTLGGATPAVAAAAAAANVASKAGTAVKLGAGAVKLAEGAQAAEKAVQGAQLAEKLAKGAQAAEKVAQGAQTAGKMAKGVKVVENAGDAAKAAGQATSKMGKVKQWASSGFQTMKEQTMVLVDGQIQQSIANKVTGMGGGAPNAVSKADGASGAPGAANAAGAPASHAIGKGPAGHAVGKGPAHGH